MYEKIYKAILGHYNMPISIDLYKRNLDLVARMLEKTNEITKNLAPVDLNSPASTENRIGLEFYTDMLLLLSEEVDRLKAYIEKTNDMFAIYGMLGIEPDPTKVPFEDAKKMLLKRIETDIEGNYIKMRDQFKSSAEVISSQIKKEDKKVPQENYA